MNKFLKLKQQANGWPANVKTEEEKIDYILRYAEEEDVTLDQTKIEKNSGLRTLAKLCLNSFWGKVRLTLSLII